MGVAAENVHCRNVVHLDIKMENFMFASQEKGSKLVLVDFGSAEQMKLRPTTHKGQHNSGSEDQLLQGQLNRVTGTVGYASPEALLGKFSPRSDVFSIGVCLYALLT